MKMGKLLKASIVGTILGMLEGLLIVFGDPTATNLILLQSVIFWFGAGIIVYISDTGWTIYKHSVFIILLLNIPWYINLTLIPNKLEHLPPMIIVSIFFGLIAGYITSKLKNIGEN